MQSMQVHNAVIFAAQKHAGQFRKGTDIPYITHPVQVMQILTENNCPENVIVAGILHDTLEDTDTTPAEIEQLFGADVLEIVSAESEDKTKTWQERKQATIDALRDESAAVQMVACADKLANVRAIYSDMQVIGDAVFNRFNAPREKLAWYYKSIAQNLSKLSGTQMLRDYIEITNLVFGM